MSGEWRERRYWLTIHAGFDEVQKPYVEDRPGGLLRHLHAISESGLEIVNGERRIERYYPAQAIVRIDVEEVEGE